MTDFAARARQMLAALDRHASGPGKLNPDQEWSDACEFLDAAGPDLLRLAAKADTYLQLAVDESELRASLAVVQERLAAFDALAQQEESEG